MVVNMSGMVVSMLVFANDMVDQVIDHGIECYGMLIVLHIGFAQVFDGRDLLGNFVFTEYYGERCATAIGTFHLGFEAASTASRCAM